MTQETTTSKWPPDSPAAHYWHTKATTHPWPLLVCAAFGLGVLVGLLTHG